MSRCALCGHKTRDSVRAQVLAAVRDGYGTAADLAGLLKISRDTAGAYLSSLHKSGLLTRGRGHADKGQAPFVYRPAGEA